MTTTTSYGTWANHGDGELAIEDNVAEAIGEFGDGYDVPALVEAYRNAINEQLPEGVTLNGDEFYGPYPRPNEVGKEIREAIERVDFWDLAAQFDTSA